MSQAVFVYTQICFDVLEDGGLVLGLVTFQQFLDYLNLAILDVYKEACPFVSIYAQTVQGGVSQYNIPDQLMRVDDCFIAGKRLDQTTISSITRELRAWSYEQGFPRYWHLDEIPARTLEILPPPNYDSAFLPGPNNPNPPNGQFGSFYATDDTDTLLSPIQGLFMNWVGPTLPTQLPMLATQAQTLDQDTGLPNDFSQTLLGYKVLQLIFSSDSELKDISRAEFCGSQYQMILGLIKIFMSEPDES